jgi:Ca-activated chloride channel family protein
MYFNFDAPWYLLLLLLLPCFLWCREYSKHYYFPKISWITRQSPLLSWEPWLKILLFTLMVFALAKPFIYDTNTNQHKKGRDLVLALDASGSMAQSGFNTKDRFKNKFETNLELASDFIKQRYDDNMGIVIFGTFAYTTSPLTYDLDSLSFLLRMTNVGIAGESTAIGEALMQSMHTLKFGHAQNKVIVLLTDGYHNAGHTSPKDAVKKAQKLGIKIYTIGIGKKSDYDVALLNTIAKETYAKSYAATSAEALDNIYNEINTLEPSAIRSEDYLNKRLLTIFPLGFVFILLLLWTLWLQRREV